MTHDFPDDADGGALRRIANDGSDMSKPMFVNFQVAVPDEAAAKTLAEVAWKLGYRVGIYASPECGMPWTCECSTRMLATHDGVLAVQRELGEIGARVGGRPDGWGTFGNGPSGHPAAG
jgi:regulator of RNase E activity RraB